MDKFSDACMPQTMRRTPINASVGYTERLSESAGRLKEGHD